jgi:hypothetical protein
MVKVVVVRMVSVVLNSSVSLSFFQVVDHGANQVLTALCSRVSYGPWPWQNLS